MTVVGVTSEKLSLVKQKLSEQNSFSVMNNCSMVKKIRYKHNKKVSLEVADVIMHQRVNGICLNNNLQPVYYSFHVRI